MWTVEGTDEFADWYGALSSQQQSEVDRLVDLLERWGPGLRRPYCDTLTGSRLIRNLKELRADGLEAGQPYHLRVLFCFDPRRTASLLLGGDQTGDFEGWYRRAIPEAERLCIEYLAELQAEGEL